MAPLKVLTASFLRPSEIHARESSSSSASASSPSSASSSLSLGVTIVIGVGIGLISCLALVALVLFYHGRRKQRMTPRVRRETWNAMESGGYGTPDSLPRKGFGRVLSVFCRKPGKPRRVLHTPSSRDALRQDQAQSRQLPDKEYEVLREPAVELQGLQDGVGGDRRALSGPEVASQVSPFEDAHRQLDVYGPVPPYDPAVDKSEQDVSLVGHYRPVDNPMPPSSRMREMDNAVIVTDAPSAAWHRKRTGPPPPLTIEPPGLHSRSPSEAYSTYATTQSAYTYSSINVPEVPPLPSHVPGDRVGAQSPYERSPSNGSSHPLQFPPSPQTPGSTPGSMSRSNSGAQEPFPLAPPTPTYSQLQFHAPTQRIPDDANFECLGPLPANIPIPSPTHFRTTQQQQPQDPFLTPRMRTPEDRSPVSAKNSAIFSSTEGETIQVGFAQDPLLHATNPFRPHHHSPTHSTFVLGNKDNQRTSTASADAYVPRSSRPHRRDSTDSLGSNFTVDEEARIQAQIVKNLDALGKERVMGEGDIVHIPQISERRYSWEE